MRILVVEDQPDLRRVLFGMLEEAGYAVDVSADGANGLAKALAEPYDAIVLDLMLPKLSGWELLQKFRERHHSPVLILSARDALQDRVQGLDWGADDYLTKPFERTELLARLRALIRRAAGSSTSTVQLGDVLLDLRTKTVSRAGDQVTLTAREYSLLAYLALHRGKVVTRTELYEHIFDEHDETLSNMIDVYVSYLRKKLGAELIETRRGLGYVIPQ